MGDVLVCIDLSAASTLVVEAAATMARGLGGRMHLLHVAAEEPVLAGYDKESLGALTRTDRARQLLAEHADLRAQAERLEADGIEVLPLLEMGATVEQIMAVADHVDAEIIVVGSHGHGAVHHLLLGSVSENLLKVSTRPVLVVPVRDRDR
jgi:nucleotide-binding universal stress UspA family protein